MKCENCGYDGPKPMVYRGYPWCSENCRKALQDKSDISSKEN